jgi:L-arabinose isomerase
MRLDVDTAGGTTHGSIKNIPEIAISVLNSKDVQFGSVETDLRTADLTRPKLVNNSTVDGLFTGDFTEAFTSGYSVDDPILISCAGAAPLTVRAIIARSTKTGR